MKNFLSLASIFVPTIFVLHFTVVVSDANLISKTCNHTPYCKFCVSSLVSDPRSSKADVRGLALIMVETVKAKATTTLNLINHQLQKRPPRGTLKQPLSSCAAYYETILSADVPEAMEALQKGDPKFAVDGMNDAASEADSCEASFRGKSWPLMNMNKVIHDSSAVAAAIIRLLL